VAVKIKLKRLGKIRAPYYRIVVADSRTKRDGRAIEEIGKYHPKEEPSLIEVKSERAQYWLGVGAQPTEAVEAILKVTGDWQRFKGQAAPEPMKVAEAKPDKKALYEAAVRAGGDEPVEQRVVLGHRGRRRVRDDLEVGVDGPDELAQAFDRLVGAAVGARPERGGVDGADARAEVQRRALAAALELGQEDRQRAGLVGAPRAASCEDERRAHGLRTGARPCA
jgi:small subunit ribosomal protein S16